MKRLQIQDHYSPRARVTVFHGDCLDLLNTLRDGSVQLIITSPPYNIGKSYESNTDIASYLQWQEKIILECRRVLKPQGSICWQIGNHVIPNGGGRSRIAPLDTLLYPIFEKLDFQLRNRIVWAFGHGLHSNYRLSGRYETINWYTLADEYMFNLDAVRVPQKYRGKRSYRGNNKGKPSGNIRGKNPSDFWDDIILKELETDVWKNIPNVKANHVEKADHPCQFPIALVRRLVRMLSNRNHLVLDPFVGSGTTLFASLIEGRRAAGAEIREEYIKITRDRLNLYYMNKLRHREDKPVYMPKGTEKVAREPSEWNMDRTSPG